MTNEELAELERLLAKVKYTAEHGVFDAAEKSMLADMEVVGTAIQSLIATAREAEALRAENARLLASVKGWAADAARLNDNADYWRQECHRLREALGLIIENEGPDTGYGNSSAKIARAALGDWKPEAGDLGGDDVR